MALATRERVNMVVDGKLMAALRARSAQAQMPMSRMIDQALTVYLMDKAQPQNGPFKAAIPVYHTIEVYAETAPDSEAAAAIRDFMATHFGGVIASPVFIARWDGRRVRGTLLQSYADDAQGAAVPELLDLCASRNLHADIIANGERIEKRA